MKKLLFIMAFLCLILSTKNTLAQTTPEILVYDFSSKTYDTIAARSYDMHLEYAKTNFSTGLHAIMDLDLNEPTSNLVEKTKFTYQEKVAEKFNNIGFPFSSSVKLVLPNVDDRHQCTGVMIAENFVLSSAHCMVDLHENTILRDEIDAIVGYDETLDSSEKLRSRVKKIYFIKDWNIGRGEDLALYELDKPLGVLSGWLSIGYDKDENVMGEVFHKMSYPAYNTPFIDEDFTGDDLHVSYGVVDYVSQEYLGIKNHISGAGGESGSPIFRTDNEDDYTAYGVLTWAGYHNHSRFNAAIYHAYEYIINNSLNAVRNSVLSPVRITSFDLKRVNNYNTDISWTTKQEISLEGYGVERSSDGVSFEHVGFVSATNGTRLSSYNYSDLTAKEGTAFYRLKSIDLDGIYTYSEVKSIEINESPTFAISIYPNPVVDYVNISTKGTADTETQLRIYDNRGKLILKRHFTNSIQLETSNYEAGLYHVIVKCAEHSEASTIIVQ